MSRCRSNDGHVDQSRLSPVDWRTALKMKLLIRNEAAREYLAECLGTFLLLRCVFLVLSSDQASLKRSSGLSSGTFFSLPFSDTVQWILPSRMNVCLTAFGFGSCAQWILGGKGFTPLTSVNFGWGFGVAFGVWVAGPVSGAHINPAVTVALAVIGKFPWRKVPHYLLGQYLGGFWASMVVFGVYYDALQHFDGGVRVTVGPNATAGIFTTLPNVYLSTQSAMFDQLVGTGLLLIGILAMTDPRNTMRPSPGMLPLCIGLFIAGLTMAFSLNMGAPINPARDLPSRIFLALAGWGKEPLSLNNYNYFWIPVVGPHIGGILGAVVYELFIGIHLPDPDVPDDVSDKECRRNVSSVELPLTPQWKLARGNGTTHDSEICALDGGRSCPGNVSE
ncbi:Aquaporin-10 [Lamellibrachia satsuma]|nr:Aquaporin-10 [Lamellibrachia satsuma]